MINIAEILKDCPKGMDLDCVLFEDVKFEKCAGDSIYIQLNNGELFALTKYGNCLEFPISKCVIFPKGETTWEDFVPPCKFKDGDIIADGYFDTICIFKGEGIIKGTVDYYCGINDSGELFIKDVKDQDEHFGEFNGYNFATEEEKEKLFKVIKDNGYRWNTETKTLEKVEPKFKVEKNLQHEWELVPNKFDINTLKPFDKVLVRGNVGQRWIIDFFGFMDNNKGFPFVCVGHYVAQCIPYEGNEHLLGTSDDCDEYYKCK